MKILLVQTAFLGDLVLSTPVVDALRELYPEAELDILVTPAGRSLLESDPRFSKVIAFEKRGGGLGTAGFFSLLSKIRARGYDQVFSLHRSFRTSLLLWLSGIRRRVGFSDSHGAYFYTEQVVRERTTHATERLLSLLFVDWTSKGLEQDLLFDRKLTLHEKPPTKEIPDGAIVFVPGSAWRTKQWNWVRYRQLAEKLIEDGERVVLAGSPEERELCDKIREDLPQIGNVAGELSLQEFVSLVRSSKGIVCNDSFALHVASVASIPCVSIFCATSPEFGFGPWKNPFAKVVQKRGLWCKPCRRHGSKVCPTGTESCMRGVRADEVHFELRHLLGKVDKLEPSSKSSQSEVISL